MAIVFYQAPMSSASPVAWALAELSVPHESVKFNLVEGRQKTPEFLALNPNGKVPTLVVDGTPMFEALAIMLWLAERYGVDQGVWPKADDPARLTAMSWSVWSYVTYGSVLRQFFVASKRQGDSGRSDPQLDSALRELEALLGMLDARLTRQPYVAGEAFSFADLIVSSPVGFGASIGVPLDAHPNVARWLQRCQARPAARAALGG